MGHGQFEHKQKSNPKKPIIGVLIIVLILAAVFCAGNLLVFHNGQILYKYSKELDLRGQELTPEEFYSLQEKIPNCHISWNIPIGGTSFSSTEERITVDNFTAEEVPLFSLFDDLQVVDASNADCYDALRMLEQSLPGCEILWRVSLAELELDTGLTALDLRNVSVSAQDLKDTLVYLDLLTGVELDAAGFSREDRSMLQDAFPEIGFHWYVELCGKTWLSTDTALDYAGETVSADALVAAAESFDQVAELNLSGCGLTLEELLRIQEAYPSARILCELEIYGVSCNWETTELDISGIQLDDTTLIESALPLLPGLEKVIMCDCGLSNEEMDALNKRHEDVLFVWTVTFSVYTLRTDATAFCASKLPSNGYVAIQMTDEQLEPLKYCTELEALDLGHMLYTDLSFLENMPNLKYLILVEARYSDITAIGTLKKLEYLELFNNTIDDLSPLLNCTSLKHLNIGFTRGFDTSVLKQMTWLERLWYPCHSGVLSDGEIKEITAALPNTQCYMPSWDSDGSTGGGWREADVYFEMRDAFDMFAMPGGTGTDGL